MEDVDRIVPPEIIKSISESIDFENEIFETRGRKRDIDSIYEETSFRLTIPTRNEMDV